MSPRQRIVVTGQIAEYPLGGVTWFYLQYVLGLRDLGHDVHYVEDSGHWPYDPVSQGLTKDPSANVDYLARVMSAHGLAERWAYRFPGGARWFGLGDAQRAEVLASADILLNVSGVLARPRDYRAARTLVYVDTDPVFTQLKLLRGQADFRRLVDEHDVHFSYGERIAEVLPSTGHEWLPTRAPIVLAEWRCDRPRRDVFTTVMNWTSHNSVEHEGVTYGQKNASFQGFLDLPARVAPIRLELAIGPGHGQRTPYDLLRHKGWELVDPDVVCPDVERFRHYTESSLAEWGVAKAGYARGQAGWFSERSARYLAAGRPVVVLDTGFRGLLPCGEGLLPFTTLDESAAAIQAVVADYETHSRAARRIAEEHFDAALVLGSLLGRVAEREGGR